MKHPRSSFSLTLLTVAFALASLVAATIAWSADPDVGTKAPGEDGHRVGYRTFDIVSNGMVVGDAWVEINSGFPSMGWDFYLLPNWDCLSEARKTNDGEEEIWTSLEDCGRIIHNLHDDSWTLLIEDSSFTLEPNRTEAALSTSPHGTVTHWTITDASEPALIGTTARLIWNSSAYTYEVRCETSTWSGYLSDQWWDYTSFPQWNIEAEGFRAYSLWSWFPIGWDHYLSLRVGNTYIKSNIKQT